ncbi:X-box-binding protein 1-like [Uloborus diversus]|uniref:X-box-binding protein 1-like n=1 Tax=Uloborus diversus TaxID=327109 RepID=UPI00240A6625|nr:X-box-binding protein 1-like [Uloborus diversus]
MPQLKKVQHISGNILPKFNISIQDIFGTYQKDDILVTSPYLPMFIDGDGSQILTSEAESDTSEVTQNRPRKRQRLDHLSQEEKIMRRKMKNRVAAQTARDRKKARMVELEELVTQLEKEKKILALANTELQKQNLALEKENSELKLRLGGKIADESIVKVEKEEKEVNEEAESRLSVESLSLEHASLINVPLQKEQDLQKLTLWMMHFVYLPAITRMMIFLLYCSSVVKILCSMTSTPPSPAIQKTENNPQILKWWGPHQKAWNPTKN